MNLLAGFALVILFAVLVLPKIWVFCEENTEQVKKGLIIALFVAVLIAALMAKTYFQIYA